MANLLTAMACYDLPVVVVLLVGDQDHPQGQGLKDLCSLRNMSFMGSRWLLHFGAAEQHSVDRAFN